MGTGREAKPLGGERRDLLFVRKPIADPRFGEDVARLGRIRLELPAQRGDEHA